jgi:branched-chain amino acid transport system substrate-binding protein
MMTRRRIALLLLASVSLSASSAARADITIAFQAPLTGFGAVEGKSGRVAAEIAVEDINSKGGVLGQKIVLDLYDDQAQGSQGIAIANKIAGDHKTTLVVSAGFSEPTRAAAPVLQAAGIPYIAATASHPDVTKAGDYVFRGSQLAQSQGAASAFLISKTSQRRVGIIALENDFGSATSEGFQKMAAEKGLTITGIYTFGMMERQFETIIAGIKRDKPDVIYLTAYPFNGGPIVAQLRAAGVTAPIQGSIGLISNVFLDIAGASAEGVDIADSHTGNMPFPGYAELMEKLKQRQGDGNPDNAVTAYAGIQMAVDAISRAGSTDQKAIRDALAATKNLQTIRGLLVGFTPGREVIEDMPVVKVSGKQFVLTGSIGPQDFGGH